MGTLTEYTFEGTPDATATTALTGAVSGTGLFYFRPEAAKIGTTGLACEGNTASANRRFAVTPALTQRFAIWFKPPVMSSGQTDRTFMSIRSSAGVIGRFRLDYLSSTTDTVEFVPNASGTATALGTVTANAFMGISAWFTVATATTGIFHIRIFDSTGTQIGADIDVTNSNLGTVNIEAYDLGSLGSFAEGPIFYYDAFKTEDAATGYLALTSPNTAPTANAGPDQTVLPGVVCTLTGLGSTDPENDTLTYAWTPPGGITLSSNTAAQPTFTTPYSMTEQTYTFGLVVTDTGALSSPNNDVVITVPAHPEWYHNGSAWKPELISYP